MSSHRIIEGISTEVDKQKFFKRIPQTMFKFRSWENDLHKRVLTHSELFFASPRRFNDPYDCSLPFNQDEGNWDVINIKKKVEEIAPKVLPHLRDNPKALEEESAKKVFQIMQDPRSWFEMNWGLYPEDIQSTFGVISLCEKYDQQLMWSHYADSHKGFCVEFSTRALFEGVLGRYQKVRYLDKLPIFSILDDFDEIVDKCIYTKSKEWEYEREHRLTSINGADTNVNFPPACLAGIYFGYNMSFDVVNEIITLTESKYPNVKYFKMNLSKSEFRFQREEIPLFNK